MRVRRLAGWVVGLLLGAGAVACTGETAGPPTEPPELPVDAIRETVASILDAPTERIVLDPASDLPGSFCRIVSGWDEGSTAAEPIRLAVLPDGSIVEGLQDESIPAVLDACYFDVGSTPDAPSMARIVVDLDAGPGPIGLADDADLRAAGRDDLDPEPVLATNGDTTTVSFLAIDREIGSLYRVQAEHIRPGPDQTRFTVSYEALDR
ncbi:MAG: hypothetical protein AAF547_12415 [Actinomycetota bacterium]